MLHTRHVVVPSLRCISALRKLYSTTSPTSSERITIPSNSRGDITVDIHHPLTRSSASPRLILHLPHFSSNDEVDKHSSQLSSQSGAEIAQQLAISSSIPVLTLNYRPATQFPFPTPIHDTLAAYDWAIQHLTPVASRPARRSDDYIIEYNVSEPSSPGTKVGVVGRGVGGSLALMLALTECRKGERGQVAAISVENAICDWSDLDHSSFPRTSSSGSSISASASASASAKARARASSTTNKTAVSDETLDLLGKESITSRLTRRDLLRMRDDLFPSPGKYFDPFASPLHFLRTPAKDVPGLNSIEEEFARLVMSSSASGEDSESSNLTNGISGKTSGSGRQRRRKVPLKWPPPGESRMLMPRMRIIVPETRPASSNVSREDENVLAIQGQEMVRLLRRALVRGSIAGRGVGDRFMERVEEDDFDEGDELEGGDGDEKHELRRITAEAENWVELLVRRAAGTSQKHEESQQTEEETRRLGMWFDAVLR